MQLFLIIAILLWASVIKTVSPQTLSTISGPSQGSLPTSTLSEDCLSTVDWHDIVFISAVPIAAGFGLLLLLAFLQDLRQAYKGKRSCRLSPIIRGNRAKKERTYVIDVDFAGRSCWGSFLRWCAVHKSSGARKHPRLVRLQGTIGFSDWLSFDLILGENSEQKTLTTPRSIGKLVAVEMKYPSASDGLNSRLPSSNIGACLRGLINRACDIEINNIHVKDTKTQDQYFSGCGPSSGGLSSSDQGITTILPLLPWTTQPASRVNYAAYFFKKGLLWTSTFIPWRQGNFTGSRHITCLFACVSYSMVAVQVMSEPLLEPSLEEFVVASPVDFDITMGMVIKAAGVSAMLFPFLILMEILGRNIPTILSSWGRPPMLHLYHHENLFLKAARGSQPLKVQSAPGNCYSSGDTERVIYGLPLKSVSAPDMQQQGSRHGSNNQQSHDSSSWCSDSSLSSIYQGTAETTTIKMKEEANLDSTLSCTSPEKANKNLSDVSPAENERKMSGLDEQQAQGSTFCKSIFMSSSLMTENQLDVMISLASSQEDAERQLTCLGYSNKNNSNQVTIVEMEPGDEPSTSLPITTNSDAHVVMDTSQSSSDLSTLQAEFTGNRTPSTTEGDPVSTDRSRSSINQRVSVAGSITTSKRTSYCMPILGAFGHILLITSCVLAVLWSVSSVHGLCWNAFWEWVATSIIAILIQAVILDTIKAIIMTVLKKRSDKRAFTPKPHSLIH